MNLTLWDFVTISGLIAAAQFLSTTLIKAKIEQSIKSNYDKQLESLKDELQRQRQKQERTWLVKRDACLKALNLTNAILSKYDYTNLPKDAIYRQDFDIVQVRECYNDLACSCATPAVLELFKKVVMGSGITLDIIVDLRNAVRKELEFGVEAIDTDRTNSFIAQHPLAKPTK